MTREIATQPANTVKAYRVTCQGKYFAHGPEGKKTVKFYGPAQFILPETIHYTEGRERKMRIIDGKEVKFTSLIHKEANAMQIVNHYVQRFCLPPYLQEKYPDVIRFRTCLIVKKEIVFIPVEEVREVTKLPIQDMTECELLQFHAMNDLITVLSNYSDLGDKKMAVEQELAEKKILQAEEAEVEDPEARFMQEPVGMSIGQVTSELGPPEEDDMLS